MRLDWVMKGDGQFGFFDLTPITTRVGTALLEGVEGQVPFVSLTYEIRSLHESLPLMKVMKERKLVPEVHLWDLDKESVELHVIFRVRKPGLRLLREMIGVETMRLLRPTFASIPCAELIANSCGGGDQKSTHVFLDLLAKRGAGVVLLSEEDGSDPMVDGINPLPNHRFMIRSVSTERPHFFQEE